MRGGGNPHGKARRRCGEVDQNLPRRNGLQHAGLAEVDILNLVGHAHAGADKVRAPSGVSGSLRPLRARIEQCVGLGARAGVDAQAVPGPQQMPRHRGTHDARPNPTDARRLNHFGHE